MTSIENILEWTCGEAPRPVLLRWAVILFSLFVLTLQISLAVSQLMLAGAGVFYAIYLVMTRSTPRFLPIKAPLALFCGLSVLSIFWSENPAIGWFAVRKMVLFLIWLLAVNLVVSARHLLRLLQGVFMVALVACWVAIVQFFIEYRDVQTHHPTQVYLYMTTRRIHGFMGHWMHFGGQEMMIFAFLTAYLLLRRDGTLETGKSKIENRNSPSEQNDVRSDLSPNHSRTEFPVSNFQFPPSSYQFRVSAFWWAILAVMVFAIVLNFTRGVWLGCFLAGIYLVARWRPKWLLALPLLMLVGYVGAPSLVRERFHMAMHPTQEAALSNRLEMWGVAIRMIRAHPWIGVGPNNIPEDYDLYMPPGKTPELGYHDHMHNDFLQFGAERGLPCLAAWVWLMAALGWHTWKLRRRLYAQRWIADATLAAGLAFLAEGCFEFNFGTSPVLMAFLFVTSTPFIAAQVAAAGLATEPEGAAPAGA